MPGAPAAGAARPRSALSRGFGAVVGGMNAAGSCWIVVLMLLINVEAVGRSAFDAPIIGVIEMIEISIVGIVFLQLADALRQGVLTRSDGLLNRMKARRPKIADGMGAAASALGVAFMALILVGSVPFFVESWEKDYYIGVEGMFTAPVWPTALTIVVAVVVTMIQFTAGLAAHFRGLAGRG